MLINPEKVLGNEAHNLTHRLTCDCVIDNPDVPTCIAMTAHKNKWMPYTHEEIKFYWTVNKNGLVIEYKGYLFKFNEATDIDPLVNSILAHIQEYEIE